MAIDPGCRQEAMTVRRRLRGRHQSDTLSHAYLEDYVRDLLPIELRCARSDPEEPRRLPPVDRQGGTLVLLVGFSIEPLLQSTAGYLPAKVLLVLNRQYGSVNADEMHDLVWHGIRRLLLPAGLVASEVQAAPKIVLGSDQPTEVFRALRGALIPRLRDGDRLIVDITGGKKSMVAGALLFGAFAGVKISYVDFDEYDPKERVPLGFTCRIGELKNPYEIFRLEDWERVRQLYHRHFFRNAGRLLDEVVASMEDWFEPREIAAARRLRDATQMYELWDNGDFSRAYREGQELSLPLPTAVEVLGKGDYWPYGDTAKELLGRLGPVEEGECTLYLDLEKLRVYIEDELAKVQRLIENNEDYRSALLRAAGLTEVLVRSRVLLLLEDGKLELAEGTPEDFKPLPAGHPAREVVRKEIITTPSVYRFVGVLRPKNKSAEVAPGFFVRRMTDAPAIPDGAVLRQEHELRNKATHTCLSVPREVALRTLEIARQSAEDYLKNWAKLGTVHVSGRLPWSKLCQHCGVDFLAPSKEE